MMATNVLVDDHRRRMVAAADTRRALHDTAAAGMGRRPRPHRARTAQPHGAGRQPQPGAEARMA
jgi:hypothetical protein